jgi:hypothetical protein
MEQAVALSKEGDRVLGGYDGYGRVGGSYEVQDGDELWHKACWLIAKKPEFTKASAHANDQGFPNCDAEEPKVQADLTALKQKAKAKLDAERAATRAYMAFKNAETAIIDEKCGCGYDTHFVVKWAGGIGVRCPNRQCNTLRPLSAEKREALAALYAAHPNQRMYDDAEVDVSIKRKRVAEEL